jgi:hypothetical protein
VGFGVSKTPYFSICASPDRAPVGFCRTGLELIFKIHYLAALVSQNPPKIPFSRRAICNHEPSRHGLVVFRPGRAAISPIRQGEIRDPARYHRNAIGRLGFNDGRRR